MEHFLIVEYLKLEGAHKDRGSPAPGPCMIHLGLYF